MAELEAITGIAKEILFGFINGNEPTEEQRRKIQLTTGVIL